jgi:hypothetical protein
VSDVPPVIASPRILWDPLAEHTTADTNLVAAAKRREIRNILKSYVRIGVPSCIPRHHARDNARSVNFARGVRTGEGEAFKVDGTARACDARPYRARIPTLKPLPLAGGRGDGEA